MGERGRQAASWFRDDRQAEEMLKVYERAIEPSAEHSPPPSPIAPAHVADSREMAQWPS
jgi:hypothetical protein